MLSIFEVEHRVYVLKVVKNLKNVNEEKWSLPGKRKADYKG